MRQVALNFSASCLILLCCWQHSFSVEWIYVNTSVAVKRIWMVVLKNQSCYFCIGFTSRIWCYYNFALWASEFWMDTVVLCRTCRNLTGVQNCCPWMRSWNKLGRLSRLMKRNWLVRGMCEVMILLQNAEIERQNRTGLQFTNTGVNSCFSFFSSTMEAAR